MKDIRIIESCENHHGKVYAIVRHSEKNLQEYRVREYEAMFMIDEEFYSFGGSVGCRVADSDTVEEAQEFLLKGMALEDTNPDVWLEMVEIYVLYNRAKEAVEAVVL